MSVPAEFVTVEYDENGDESPSPLQPETPTEQLCALCGDVACSDGSLPDGTTVASKLAIWQSLGHVPDCREIPEGAPLCQSCVDLVVSTQDLDDNLDDNFELLWSLLRAGDDDDDIIFEGVYEGGEFESNWRKNLGGPPIASKYRQSVLFPAKKKYLRISRYKVCFGEQNKGPTVDQDQCVICKDAERAVANAATWHFPESGKLVVEKMQAWCKARRPEPCRPLRRPAVPLCQLCVDMLLDTEDMETKILENLVLLSRMVKEDPKLSHVAVGTGDQLLEDLDVKPEVLPSILVRTEMDGEDGSDLVDVKPDIDILQNRLENISQHELADVKQEYEGLAAPVPEGLDPLAPGNGSVPLVLEEQEEKPVITRSGRAVKRSAAALQSLSFLAQFSDSDDSDVEVVHAKVKNENVASGTSQGRGRPNKSKAPSKEMDDEWYISDNERGEANGEEDIEESDDAEDDSDEPGEDEMAMETEELKKSAPGERSVAERVAGAALWLTCKCRACGKELDNDVALDSHFKEEHACLQPYACHFCLLEFKKGDDFVQHVMIEELKKEAEGEFKCKHCDENFPNPRFLSCHHGDNHMCEDTEGGPFKCKECSLSFPAFMQFVEHRQKPLKEHTDAAPNHRPELKCRLCGCESETEKSYDEHLQAMHSGTAKLFECPRCSSWFASMKLLVKHFYNVEFNAKRECEFCGLRFPTVLVARQHKKKEHPTQSKRVAMEKITICPHCGIDVKELDRHITRVHRKEKREKCQFCGERFVYQRALARHLALVHEYNVKVIQHPCPECGKVMSSSKGLKKHLLGVHGILKGGQNTFNCTHCERKFTDSRQLKEHTYSHEGIKPHQCPHCDHRTVTFVNLKTHLKWKHRRICSRKFHEDASAGDDLAYEIVDEGPWIREETAKAPRSSKKNEEEGDEPKKKGSAGRKRSKKTTDVGEEEEQDEEEAFLLDDEEQEIVPSKKKIIKKKASNGQDGGDDGSLDEAPKKKTPRKGIKAKAAYVQEDLDLDDFDESLFDEFQNEGNNRKRKKGGTRKSRERKQ